MTILNATLTDTTFILSQDEAHVTPGGAFVAHAPKVITSPARRYIAGSAGNVSFSGALGTLLDRLPVLNADRIGAELRVLPDAHPDQLAVVGWWCDASARPVAYAFQAQNGFTPVPLEAGRGHVISPAEAWIEDHAGMLKASQAAVLGNQTEAFHVRLARAQKEAAKRGLINKPGWRPHSIGGRLHIARLDRQGVIANAVPVFGPEGFTSVGDVLAARWVRHPAAA